MKTKTVSAKNELHRELNSILQRKDILEINNDRVDTLRLLTYSIENNEKISNFIKFLKG